MINIAGNRKLTDIIKTKSRIKIGEFYSTEFLNLQLFKFFEKKTTEEIIYSSVHGVKGETFDATLLVVDSVRGNTVTPSLLTRGDLNNELMRIAYVAMTRPRKLLVVSIPKQKSSVALNRFPFELWDTELVFILDRSGSMSGLEGDTIGGFNSMIEKQKKQDGGCYVSTVLFDDESEVLHDRVKLTDIPKMTDEDYTVRGCTALIDAIGGAIHHIGNIHKYARPEDVPEHTMFIITTDGQENASHRYSSEQVKKMIERQKEKYGWEFLFIGANIDAVETAARYGIDKDRAVNYNADGHGTHILYESVAKAVCNVRASAPLGADWSEEINADYQRRGKKNKK